MAAEQLFQQAREALRARDAGRAAALIDELGRLDRSARVAQLRSWLALLQGRSEEAIALARRAVALEPARVELHLALAHLLVEHDRPGEALAELRTLVGRAPGSVAAWRMLGVAQRRAGDLAGALASFERLLALQPSDPVALRQRAVCLNLLGRRAEAAEAARAALGSLALDAEARLDCADVLLQGGHRTEGLAALTDAALADGARRPTVLAGAARLAEEHDAFDALAAWPLEAGSHGDAGADAFDAAAADLEATGHRVAAQRVARAALRRFPDDWSLQVRSRLLLPEVLASAGQIDGLRAEWLAGLEFLTERLASAAERVDARQLEASIDRTNFFLAYHGRDDRPLQEAYGRFLSHAWRRLDPQAGPRPDRGGRRKGPLRIGIVSAFLRDCTVGRYFARWLEALRPPRFECVLVPADSRRDGLTARMAALCSGVVPVHGLGPVDAARRIRELDLDIAWFPEIGMHGLTMALAGTRLAAVQCASWGHPVTTGLPTIDAFFSCRSMEPDDAQAGYTERLVLLPGIGTCYSAPARPASRDRPSLGLPDGAPLVFYPHSPFKVHPAGDAALFDVLDRLPRARLVLVDGPTRRGTGLLRRRLLTQAAARGVDAGRLVWLPSMAHERYLEVARACDFMIDPWGWSGGNTALDAVAAGLPFIAQPGRMMRSRQSAAFLQMLGLDALIASSEADLPGLAGSLWEDAAARSAARQRMFDEASGVFDDGSVLPAIADAFERLGRGEGDR